MDHVYTECTRTLDFYKQKYPKNLNKHDFLPTWGDEEVCHMTDKPKELVRQELALGPKIPQTHTWILFVGRLQQQKDPLRLIEAFYEYRRKKKKSCLLIIGEGNLKGKILQKARTLGIYPYTHFFGYRSHTELAKFYQAAVLRA